MSATTPSGRATWADVDACVAAGLARTVSERGKASLLRVAEAIQALRRAETSITFASVGEWCVQKYDGPTSQSIQNNERAADIVRAAAAVQATDARPRSGRPAEADILDQIGVPAQRALLEGFLAHRRALIVEVADLRAAFRRTEAIAFLSREMAEAKVETLDALAAEIRTAKTPKDGMTFTEDQRAACRAFVSSDMGGAGLKVDEPSGEIIDRSLRTVAKSGVAEVLRMVGGLGVLERAAKPIDVPSRRRSR